MKKRLIPLLLMAVACCLPLQAEDGHRLWLRYDRAGSASVEAPQKNPTISIASQELRDYYKGRHAILRIDQTMPDDDGYSIRVQNDTLTVSARRPVGLLYGAYEALRQQAIRPAPPAGKPKGRRKSQAAAPLSSHPAFALRLLNHWDNLDGTIERGYAGESILEWFRLDEQLIRAYARANASIGINGSVLNNVNASPKMLTTPYLKEVRKIADWLRPYGIRVYLSINFATPMALGDTKTADPLDKSVAAWWKKKAKEIYRLVPDFGGFLVKANSEGQPGPGDYKRTHAEGANMLADAMAPHGGIIMWRAFVYGYHEGNTDRVMKAVNEFKPLDGQFRKNVIIQIKNGPLDFQPCEPYSPLFDQLKQTPMMAELQITQEYLGQSRHLVYLGPMWTEFFNCLKGSPNPFQREGTSEGTFAAGAELRGAAGVANIGLDENWCGHHFSQANWYVFGRLAWNPNLSSRDIAREWLQQTFTCDDRFVGPMTDVMESSREACVDYMMPLGLHHIFKGDHHYGPEPEGNQPNFPDEWKPVWYHKADKQGIGFNRSTHGGTGASQQYRSPYKEMFDNVETCPEEYLLWFHHLPWTFVMPDGQTLWESLKMHYDRGVKKVDSYVDTWQQMRPYVDEQRFRAVAERLRHQQENAREWRNHCIEYFAGFAQKE